MTDYIKRSTAIELMKKEAAEMSESFKELGGEPGIYAVDAATSNFLIYKDDAWQWTPMDWCKPYCPTSESFSRTYLIHHGLKKGGTDTE